MQHLGRDLGPVFWVRLRRVLELSRKLSRELPLQGAWGQSLRAYRLLLLLGLARKMCWRLRLQRNLRETSREGLRGMLLWLLLGLCWKLCRWLCLKGSCRKAPRLNLRLRWSNRLRRALLLLLRLRGHVGRGTLGSGAGGCSAGWLGRLSSGRRVRRRGGSRCCRNGGRSLGRRGLLSLLGRHCKRAWSLGRSTGSGCGRSGPRGRALGERALLGGAWRSCGLRRLLRGGTHRRLG